MEVLEVLMVMAWLLSRGAQVSPVYWYLRRSTQQPGHILDTGHRCAPCSPTALHTTHQSCLHNKCKYSNKSKSSPSPVDQQQDRKYQKQSSLHILPSIKPLPICLCCTMYLRMQWKLLLCHFLTKCKLEVMCYMIQRWTNIKQHLLSE